MRPWAHKVVTDRGQVHGARARDAPLAGRPRGGPFRRSPHSTRRHGADPRHARRVHFPLHFAKLAGAAHRDLLKRRQARTGESSRSRPHDKLSLNPRMGKDRGGLGGWQNRSHRRSRRQGYIAAVNRSCRVGGTIFIIGVLSGFSRKLLIPSIGLNSIPEQPSRLLSRLKEPRLISQRAARLDFPNSHRHLSSVASLVPHHASSLPLGSPVPFQTTVPAQVQQLFARGPHLERGELRP